MKRQTPVVATPQRGAVLPLVVISLVVLIGMSGLALDLGHAYVNKTRLQNALDAAALSGAKTLDLTNNSDQATNAARATFAHNLAGSGNQEMQDALDPDDVIVEFSDTLSPFNTAAADPQFVRVRVTNFDLGTWFVQVLPGVDDVITVAASAVAGWTPICPPNDRNCGLAPFAACGTTGGEFHGYTLGTPARLKTGAGTGWEVGPGNFQMIRLEGPGADLAREAAAGGTSRCLSSGNTVETQPGNMVSVSQGLNTRFGVYAGPMGGEQATYPPDVIVTENTATLNWDDPSNPPTERNLTYSWTNYETQRSNATYYDYPPPSAEGNCTEPLCGRFERRIIIIPIINCDGTRNGQGPVTVLGIGCFFLTQRMEQQGNRAYVYGQFVEDCLGTGVPGPEPCTGSGGPHIIQLYKNPDSPDS